MTAKRKTTKSVAKKKTKAKSSAARARSAKKATKKKKTKPGSRVSAKRTVKKKPAAKTTKKKAKSKPAAAKKTPKKKTTAKKTTSRSGKPKAKVKRKRQPPLEIRRFRKELRAKQAELLQAYMNAKGDSRARESDGTEDYIDYAVSSYDREFLLSLTELEQSQLNLVEEALKRISAGAFGLCVQCEKPIPVKRLEVQPWARYCLRCQELADLGLADDDDDFGSDDDEADVGADEADADESEDAEETEGAVGGRLLSR
jgi:DnaK suppressor protein